MADDKRARESLVKLLEEEPFFKEMLDRALRDCSGLEIEAEYIQILVHGIRCFGQIDGLLGYFENGRDAQKVLDNFTAEIDGVMEKVRELSAKAAEAMAIIQRVKDTGE